MNIAVILRQVPDTEAVVKPDPSRPGAILEAGVKFILNPYDEYAVEEAVRITEDEGGSAVGFCIGPERSESALRTALAMGLERVVWVAEGPACEADLVTQARILAAAIRGFSPSLVLCGREFIDTQEDAMAAAVGRFLDMPHVLCASKISLCGERASVVRESDGASLEIDVPLPAAVSCAKGMNEPRYPTLIAIKRSKNKEIRKVALSEMSAGPIVSKSRVAGLLPPSPRAKGVRVSGDAAEAVAKALDWLSSTAKVI